MYTVEVAPLVRGTLKNTLTFFSRTYAPPGSIVRAPIRNRLVPALVLSATDVRDDKLDVKSAGYALKKLGSGEPRQIFSEPLMHAAHELAQHFVTTEAAILSELSFSALLSSPRRLAQPARTSEKREVVPEVLTLQAELAERLQTYRNLVREAFARDKSVMLIAPTLVEVERLKTELERGIEDRVVVATSAITPKELRRAWDRALEQKAPLVLIGTPPVLSFSVPNLDAIIIEREGARAYVTRTRAALDIRTCAERIAAFSGARCVLADFPLRAETFARRDLGTADDLARPQVRTQSLARITVVDARLTDPKRETRRSFTALQPVTYEAIQDTLARGGRIAIYAARKGIAPLTVCNDCGTPITDPTTDTPMVLHKTPKGNVFVSHRSGAVVTAERSCAVCGGWNLVSLGIGVDRVAEEVHKRTHVVPYVFTADTVQTHKAALRLIDALNSAPGSLIVGTERMLPYLPDVELVVVASIDSVLSLPSWRAHEHALATLYALIARATERVLVETRRPHASVLTSIANGSPIEYLREELRERKTYGYPPYATFIGLTWYGTEAECATHARTVLELLSEYDLVGPLPAEQFERARYRQRAVVRRDRGAWPDSELVSLLRSLPTEITCTVDPDDIV